MMLFIFAAATMPMMITPRAGADADVCRCCRRCHAIIAPDVADFLRQMMLYLCR